MARWLFKEEPGHYNFADLERDGKTRWEGVRNPLALQHLRQVRRGDRVFFYHTGKEKAVVGEMRVVEAPSGDSAEAEGVGVEVAPVRRLARPVHLQEIKDDTMLRGWDLVRLPRLSVLPVTPEQWRRVEELSESGG